MPVLAAVNVEVAYGEDVILDGVSLTIEAGERIGIVGRNGEGKSTLVKAMAGVLPCDKGRIERSKTTRIGYLAQNPDLDPSETVRGSAEAAFGELHEVQRRLEGVFEKMGDAEGAALEKLMAQQERLEKQVEALGGYAVGHKIDATLHGLGFVDAQFGLKVGVLSGGQRARLGLARLLLERPDVLLMDEPTNHLDIDGRRWLETFLRDEYQGAVVLISHDRYLLDAVVNRIVEVEYGGLIDYPGNYAAFRELRAERRLAQHRAWEKQQTAFKREEAFIRKYKAGQRAKQAQGRLSRLERAKSVGLDRPMEFASLRLSLPKAERTGDVVASVRGVSKAYTNESGGTKTLFDGLDLVVGKGERWGIVGPNGAGKSTLVACMLGDLQADAGSVRLGTNLRIGHFKQEEAPADPEMVTYRYVQKLIKDETDGAVVLSEQEARNLAGAFLFSGDDQEKEIGVLSGGERARCRLAGLIGSGKNVLVLDEPTNHLDIPSAERLESALSHEGGFDGVLILISHDRAMLDACCDSLIVLDGTGGAEVFHGGYSEWRAREDARVAAAPTATQARAKENSQTGGTPVPPRTAQKGAAKADAKSKFSWMSVERLEERIGQIEARLGEIDAALDDPDVWTDYERANTLTEERDGLKAELDGVEAEWVRKA